MKLDSTNPITPEANSLASRKALSGAALEPRTGGDTVVPPAKPPVPFLIERLTPSFFPRWSVSGRRAATVPAATRGSRGLKYRLLRLLPYAGDVVGAVAIFVILFSSLFIGAAIQ